MPGEPLGMTFCGVAWSIDEEGPLPDSLRPPDFYCAVGRDDAVPIAEWMAASVLCQGMTLAQARQRAFDAAEEIETLQSLPWNLAEMAANEHCWPADAEREDGDGRP